MRAQIRPPTYFLTVDAGRLWLADQEGVFAPVQSKVLNERIPAAYRLASNTGTTCRPGRG